MTTCNPVNLSYRFALSGKADVGFREAADPSIVRYCGEYWLFASKSGGYWRSYDLAHWTFVATRTLETEAYAPDAAVVRASLVTTATGPDSGGVGPGRVPIFCSNNPGRDEWEKAADAPPHADVCLFEDDDGRVFRYDGCSNKKPLYGCEVDAQTFLPIGARVVTYVASQAQRGWERGGDDHAMSDAPWIEGSWMSKHRGRYYLQYAAPGTQWNVYCDSVVVSDSPLGPFRLQEHNPFSYKPTGFIAGAGHGSTFQDEYGNWWHTSTLRICARYWTERRVGLWPAGFDEDGVLFCNTSFGDWPMRMPTGKWDPWRDPFAGWMLLSYRANCTASSTADGHPAEYAFDESVRSWWAAASSEPAMLTVDLGDQCEVNALQINFAEHDAAIYGRGGNDIYHAYMIEGSGDGSRWNVLVDKSASLNDVPHDFIDLNGSVRVRHLRLRIEHVPGGTPAVSGFRVFGRASGDPPEPPQKVELVRPSDDRRSLGVRWSPQNDATGYQLWWGVAPDKLYSSCLVYGRSDYELRCLNSELGYYVAVEAFSRSGRSALSQVVATR